MWENRLIQGSRQKQKKQRRIALLFDEFKRQMGHNPNWLPGSLTEQWINVYEIVKCIQSLAVQFEFMRENNEKSCKKNTLVVDDWTALDFSWL